MEYFAYGAGFVVNVLLVFLWYLRNELKKYKNTISFYERIQSEDIKDSIESARVNFILKSDLEVAQARVKELEDGVASEYGVPVRRVVEEVKCDFDKVEMIFICEGIKTLLQKSTNNIYDIEYYTKLWKRVDDIQKKLPELIPENEDKEKEEDGRVS